jgi:hypothetical protein
MQYMGMGTGTSGNRGGNNRRTSNNVNQMLNWEANEL